MDMLSYNIGSLNINGIANDNKLNALRSFVYMMDLDVLMLQEVHEHINISGFDTFSNIDLNKRGTAILVKSHIKTSHIQKSIDSRIISLKIENHTTICNIYAPSGSAQKALRERFFTDTVHYYINHGDARLIVGGDFNSVIDKKDANHSSNFSQSLKFFVQSLKLKDAWEIVHKNTVDYTFIRNGSGARLDRIYVSEDLKEQVRTVQTNLCSFSDHKVVIMKLRLPNLGRSFGRGLWRLNDIVLTEENLAEYREKWAYWVRQKRYFDSWFSWWNEYAKVKTASFFKWKYSLLKRRYHDSMEFFYAALNILYKDYLTNPGLLSEIQKVKGKMLALQREITNHFYTRSETFICGENASIYQVGEQKQRREKTKIKSLLIHGQEESNIEIVTKEITQFYKTLYANSPTNASSSFEPENTVPDNFPANRELMDPISEDELLKAIKSSQSRKSPGSDGLTKTFYVKCWEIIKSELVFVANEVINGKTSAKFLEGVIVLIKKKNANNSLGGYRPITLLNFDYKLVSRILKNRLIKLNGILLSNTQKCSNGSKTIFEATCGIRDKILEINLKKKKGVLISFDLEKAFDRVNYGFLLRTLSKMGINNRFVEFIKISQENTFSRILINGNLSESIRIERSVRQGDPLAMILFCLYLEPLLQKLNRICEVDVDLLVSYADDISLIIHDIRKLCKVKQIFEDFESVAGAKVNYEKTRAMKIGSNNNYILPDWIEQNENIKILGLWYNNNSNSMMQKNWDEVLQSLRFLLWNSQFRSLNLIQKVIFLNTYASSRIWYMSSTISVNKKTLAKIKTLYGNFLWYRSTLRVSFDQLCLPRKLGGLGLIAPEYKCKSLLINRYLRLRHVSPFLHVYTDRIENPPNVKDLPVSAHFLKIIYLELAYIPENIKHNPTSHSIYSLLCSKLPKPHVIEKYPQYNWNVIWKNVFDRHLSSDHQVTWFLLINEKIICAEKQFRFGSRASPNCSYCPQEIEDLKHKFSTCSKVRNCWWFTVTKIKLLNRRKFRNVSFDTFKFPVLRAYTEVEKTLASRIFVEFLNYVFSNDPEVLSVDVLKFSFDCNRIVNY